MTSGSQAYLVHEFKEIPSPYPMNWKKCGAPRATAVEPHVSRAKPLLCDLIVVCLKHFSRQLIPADYVLLGEVHDFSANPHRRQMHVAESRASPR